MVVDTADERRHELDARTIDGEPFSEIMAALSALSDDETLVLINSFEPDPLYTVLEQRGFTHETSQVADDEWHVSITHG
ncbi:DUF2249 domain-containing protein [Halobium palmae]|uniref:DUF2249 domain-containing protein n=1 Tax=Halobium palmae TaxID=1776492 RepID=A0ABD5RUP5_9EURY